MNADNQTALAPIDFHCQNHRDISEIQFLIDMILHDFFIMKNFKLCPQSRNIPPSRAKSKFNNA